MANGNGNGGGVTGLPDNVPVSIVDDTGGSTTNIAQLKSGFIDKIDQTRSEFLNGKTTGGLKQESRFHAFLRMLGMPIIRANGTFYNPGYNPPSGELPDRPNEVVPVEAFNIHEKRESEVRKFRDIFQYAGVDSTVYALALGVADGMKPFYIEGNEQSFTKSARKDLINARYTDSEGNEFVRFFETGFHFVRPLTPSPQIIVKPGNKHVCAPFLTEKNTIYEGKDSFDVKLPRPGLELIARYRLRDEGDDTAFSDALATLVTDTSTNSANPLAVAGLGRADLVQVVSALIEEGSVNEDSITLELQNLTSFELININGFVKAMKALIKVLAQSFMDIEEVSKMISWTPLPDQRGPEFGCRQGTFAKRKTGKTKLERRLSMLKLKASEPIPEPSNKINIQDFAIVPFISSSTKKKQDNRLQDTSDQIQELQDIGSRALRNIENIIGDASGFGMIDIFALLIALWSVDKDALVSLFDNEAFERLYSNEDLRSAEVEIRHENGEPFLSITDALTEVENKMNNVLDFADRLFEFEKGQNEGEGGEPARS